ncbi:MAG: BglG family transcription antiterminator [Spirochaetaceae bacterium]|jgi:mannitol operon transcriptional antiterminator|nr:BglG family transcription antiterminator [Spirochaetaceae bacterium]
MRISPVLSRLLYGLLLEDDYISIDKLAEIIGRSRRTVFRELKNVEPVLPGLLTLETETGKGVRLVCSNEARRELLDQLQKNSGQKIRSRKERLFCLLSELLGSSGRLQKLSYYSAKLFVSESTVSADIDVLERFLKKYSVVLIRRPGAGVYAQGSEENIRTALAMRLFKDGNIQDAIFLENTGFPTQPAACFVTDFLNKEKVRFDWMTEECLELFACFLVVMVERVLDGHFAESRRKFQPEKKTPENQAAAVESVEDDCAKAAAEAVESRFSITLPPEEREYIAAKIRLARAKDISPLTPPSPALADYIEELTMRLIDAFDEKLSPALKTNEKLTSGLCRHLYPAIERIKKGVELPDPFENQLQVQNPGLYENVKQAARILEKELNAGVNETEISFIAIHFYAALFAIDVKNTHKRVLIAGIVCQAGIGVSYMIASQLEGRYKGELEIKITPYSDCEAWDNMDFLISTTPIPESQKTVVVVNAILGEEDFIKIREIIMNNAFVEKKKIHLQKHSGLIPVIERVLYIINTVKKMLCDFNIYKIESETPFEELALFCAETFSASSVKAALIFKNLTLREKLVSQVIPGLNLVLLHARCEGVTEPVFAVIRPEGGVFTDNHFKEAEACVLMLLPKDSSDEITSLMGALSAALVETPAFPAAIKTGGKASVYAIMEAELSGFLSEYCKSAFGNSG